jgi:LysM repeat protein
VAGGIIILLLVVTVAISQAMGRPRAAVESASSHRAATSETSLGVVPAVPPEVARPEIAAPRPPKFSSKPIEPSYTVASGDTLSSIAQRYNTNAEALRLMNNLPDTRLNVGQRLIIP